MDSEGNKRFKLDAQGHNLLGRSCTNKRCRGGFCKPFKPEAKWREVEYKLEHLWKKRVDAQIEYIMEARIATFPMDASCSLLNYEGAGYMRS